MSETEERRSMNQDTIENTVAIGKLTALQERATKDLDNLVNELKDILPLHSKLANLRTITYGAVAIFLSFATWITLDHFRLSEETATHIAVQKVQEEKKDSELKAQLKDIYTEIKKNNQELLLKVNHNENQVTYCKGRITGLDNQIKSTKDSGISIRNSAGKR